MGDRLGIPDAVGILSLRILSFQHVSDIISLYLSYVFTFFKIICSPKKGLCYWSHHNVCKNSLSMLSTDTTGELDILGHNGDTVGVDGTQVGVFKESYEVGLRSFL